MQPQALAVVTHAMLLHRVRRSDAFDTVQRGRYVARFNAVAGVGEKLRSHLLPSPLCARHPHALRTGFAHVHLSPQFSSLRVTEPVTGPPATTSGDTIQTDQGSSFR